MHRISTRTLGVGTLSAAHMHALAACVYKQNHATTGVCMRSYICICSCTDFGARMSATMTCIYNITPICMHAVHSRHIPSTNTAAHTRLYTLTRPFSTLHQLSKGRVGPCHKGLASPSSSVGRPPSPRPNAFSGHPIMDFPQAAYEEARPPQ